MIESLMLCGIGLLAGCVLMLLFFPLVHARAVRLTRQQLVDAKPLTVNEIQADKDHLRAQFAMSVRRLEIGMEEMRAKAPNAPPTRAARRDQPPSGRARQKDGDDFCLARARGRAQKRRQEDREDSALYLCPLEPPAQTGAAVFAAPQHPTWEFEHEPDAGELASTAAAIAAVNLKRRQAVSNRH